MNEPTHPLTPELDGEVLDAEGARQLLSLGKNQLYAACHEGLIPHRRIGRTLRFSRSAILAWLGSQSKILSGRGAG